MLHIYIPITIFLVTLYHIKQQGGHGIISCAFYCTTSLNYLALLREVQIRC